MPPVHDAQPLAIVGRDQLDAADRCLLFGDPRRPAVCASLKPSPEMCGEDRTQALQYLDRLEALTSA